MKSHPCASESRAPGMWWPKRPPIVACSDSTSLDRPGRRAGILDHDGRGTIDDVLGFRARALGHVPGIARGASPVRVRSSPSKKWPAPPSAGWNRPEGRSIAAGSAGMPASAMAGTTAGGVGSAAAAAVRPSAAAAGPRRAGGRTARSAPVDAILRRGARPHDRGVDPNRLGGSAGIRRRAELTPA